MYLLKHYCSTGKSKKGCDEPERRGLVSELNLFFCENLWTNNTKNFKSAQLFRHCGIWNEDVNTLLSTVYDRELPTSLVAVFGS